MLDLICIRSRSGGKHWPEAGRMILAHQLASGLDPFGQKLTQSARTKSDLGWFCTVLSGSSVDNRTESKSWKLWLHPARNWKPGPMIPALACFQTRCVWPNPDQAIQIRSVLLLHNITHAFFGRTELKRMLAVRYSIYYPAWFWWHAGRNGHNWL